MKTMKRRIITVLLISVMVFALSACGVSSQKEVSNESSQEVIVDEAGALNGELTLGGSTSVEKIGVALGDEFMALNPDVSFSYDATGSSAGVKAAGSKTVMIGTASRGIKDNEKDEFKLDEKVLAYDGIAVAVHPSNAIVELSKEQVAKIYKGEIANWSEVGGEDLAIVVVSREDGSGTRGAFEEVVDFEDTLTTSALLADGNGNVQATVAGETQAIGYVSFTYINDTIKPVKIDGANPTVEEVLGGSYPISRPFNMVFYESELSEVGMAFLAFVSSNEALEIIGDKGGIAPQ